MGSIIEIRKYPNRRYYNTRDSRHVTLEEIRDLVRDGQEIRVVDSKTDEDITVAVLTQILLEIESPKLAFFPSSFLQHLIRLNSDMFKSMSESYFRNSLASFMKSAESAQAGVGGAFGAPLSGAMENMQRMWLGMMPKSGASAAPPPEAAPEGRAKPEGNVDRVAELSKQIDEMRRMLEQLQKSAKK